MFSLDAPQRKKHLNGNWASPKKGISASPTSKRLPARCLTAVHIKMHIIMHFKMHIKIHLKINIKMYIIHTPAFIIRNLCLKAVFFVFVFTYLGPD